MVDHIIFIDSNPYRIDFSEHSLDALNHPGSKIIPEHMKNEGEFYMLRFDPETRQASNKMWQAGDIIDKVLDVVIPVMLFDQQFWQDERKFENINKLSRAGGWNVWIANDELSSRLLGKLNTVDIAGHTFYVDIPMDMLRPKDDFLSNGIRFGDIGRYLNDDATKYRICYNPSKHEFFEYDASKATEIPKDVKVIEFVHESSLDPVGYARKNGIPVVDLLKNIPFRAHFNARVVPWEETSISQMIKKNLAPQQGHGPNTKKSRGHKPKR